MDQIKGIMKLKIKSIEDIVRVYVYRPYDFLLSYMVDKEERIYIKTDHWMVILDHNTGDFSFTGELHKYYEVDMISSIRDYFGELYSVFNNTKSVIPTDTWIKIDNFDAEIDELLIVKQAEEKARKSKYMKEYYIKNREKYLDSQRRYREKIKNKNT